MTIPTGSRVRIIDATGIAEPYATRLVGLTGVLDRVEGPFFYVRRGGEVGFGNECPMAGTWQVLRVVPVIDVFPVFIVRLIGRGRHGTVWIPRTEVERFDDLVLGLIEARVLEMLSNTPFVQIGWYQLVDAGDEQWREATRVALGLSQEEWELFARQYADQKTYQWKGDGTDSTATLSDDVTVRISAEHLRALVNAHREQGQREGRKRLAVEVRALVPVLTTAGEEALDLLLHQAIKDTP